MTATQRISHTISEAWSAARKAWKEPTAKSLSQIEAVQEVPNIAAQPISNAYYVDTLSKVGEELPQVQNDLSVRGRVETQLERISAEMDSNLSLENRDFDKLQTLIYNVIMLMMRLAAKTDQQNIYEISVKIKKQAVEIKETYNTWQGLTVTVVSAGISFAGAAAGLSPFLPASVITAESARAFSNASTSIGSAGTGLSGIGSIFNNRSEGDRQVKNIYLKRSQDTEEERKGSKHNKGDQLKTAKAAAEEYARTRHEAHKAAAAA